MIEKTISELEAKIRSTEISAAHQRELFQLLARLKTEIGEREQKNLQPLKLSVEELRTSVEGFEQSHPNSSKPSTASATRWQVWGFNTRSFDRINKINRIKNGSSVKFQS